MSPTGRKRKLEDDENEFQADKKKPKTVHVQHNTVSSCAKRKLCSDEDNPTQKKRKTICSGENEPNKLHNQNSIQNTIKYTKDYIPVRTIHVNGQEKKLDKKSILKYFRGFGCIKRFNCPDVGEQWYQRNDDNAMHSYWYVTFVNATDACRALAKKHHKLLGENVRVLPAHSWQQEDCPNKQNRIAALVAQQEDQPDLNKNADEATEKKSIKLTDINADCLHHILSHLDYEDLIAIADTCTKLNEFAQAFHAKYKKPTFFNEFRNADVTTAGRILAIFGENITEMKLTNMPNIDNDEFDLKVKYYHNIINQNCEHLQTLTWGYIKSSLNFEAFKNRQLNKLTVICEKGLTDWLKIVNHFNCTDNLEHLTISKGNASVESIKCLSEFKNLRILELIGVEHIPSAKYLICLKQLQELKIDHAKYIKSANDIIAFVEGLPNLIALKIPTEGHFITKRVYKHLVDVVQQRDNQLTLCIQSVWHPIIPQQLNEEYNKFVQLQGYVHDDGQFA